MRRPPFHTSFISTISRLTALLSQGLATRRVRPELIAFPTHLESKANENNCWNVWLQPPRACSLPPLCVPTRRWHAYWARWGTEAGSVVSNSPLGPVREAGRLSSWRTGQLSGGTAPGGSLRRAAGSVSARIVGPADRWHPLEFWLHYFLALPQSTHLLNEDSLL